MVKSSTSRQSIEQTQALNSLILSTTSDNALVDEGYVDILRLNELIKNKTTYASNAVVFQERNHPVGIWCFGFAGTGKSTFASEFHQDLKRYVHGTGKFIDPSAVGCELVIFEDLRAITLDISVMLNRMADANNMKSSYEMKGGHISIQPRHTLVTSNYSPFDYEHIDPIVAESIARRYRPKYFKAEPRIQPEELRKRRQRDYSDTVTKRSCRN
jgi:hypothetical protein